MSESRLRAAWAGVVVAAVAAMSGCGDDSASPASNVALTYCDAAPILALKCQRCHQDPPESGAPFPLLSYADTQVPAPLAGDAERKRAADMLGAIETNYMPYMGLSLDPPVSPLTCAERTTLLNWLRKGASPPPAGQEDCHGVTPVLLPCSD